MCESEIKGNKRHPDPLLPSSWILLPHIRDKEKFIPYPHNHVRTQHQTNLHISVIVFLYSALLGNKLLSELSCCQSFLCSFSSFGSLCQSVKKTSRATITT